MNQLEITFQESEPKEEDQVSEKERREQRNRQEAQLSEDGSYFVIRLTKGKEAKIDIDELERVASYRWKATLANTKFYAKRSTSPTGQKRVTSLSRYILNAPEGVHVDHINGDSLDNRKSNLRLCTHRENHYASRVRKSRFSSKYRGVYWSKCDKRWVAHISYNWKGIHIGHFKSEKEAAIARDFFSHMLHGDFAQINVTDDTVECTLIEVKGIEA